MAVISYFASVVGALASMGVAIISLVVSCQAQNTARLLKEETEKVAISFKATLQVNKEIKLLRASAGKPTGGVLLLYATLFLNNRNSFRAVVVEELIPLQAYDSLVTPSELKVRPVPGAKTFPLALSPLDPLTIEVRITWPIGPALTNRVRALLSKSKQLMLKDLLWDIGRGRRQDSYFQRYSKVVLRLRTERGHKFEKTLTLY